MMRIREITDAAGWRSLEPHWDLLLQRSRVDCFFLTWDWLDTWMTVYGDGGEWLILVAEDDGQIRGIAPMMIDPFGRRVPARFIRRLTLLGQKADTASEYLDWIIESGREDEIARAFCHHLFTKAAHRWDVLEFGIMRADSPVLPVLRAMFGEAWTEQSESESPFMALPESWDVMLATRKPKFRQRLNRFERDHSPRFLIGGEDISLSEGIALLSELNRERWKEKGSSFRSERYIRFHGLLAPRMAAKSRLLLMFMQCGSEIVAGRYDFVYGGKGWSFQGGWKPDWEKYSVGKMMLRYVIRWCVQRGLREYDFLAGKSSYKDDLASGGRAILRAQAWRPGSARGFCWQQLRALRSHLSSL